MNNETCLCNFGSQEEYDREFCATEEKTEKCNQCNSFTYKDGIMSCSKFDQK